MWFWVRTPVEGESSRPHPDWPRDPISFLYDGYRVCLFGVNRLKRGVDHTPSSSAKSVNECAICLLSTLLVASTISGMPFLLLRLSLSFLHSSVKTDRCIASRLCSVSRLYHLPRAVAGTLRNQWCVRKLPNAWAARHNLPLDYLELELTPFASQ